MNVKSVILISVATIFLRNGSCELLPESVTNLVQTYATNVNTSIILSKSDRQLLNSWNDMIQVMRVNVTTKYRMQMIRHKDHSFKKGKLDKKWVKCMDQYETQIAATETIYYENESGCLRTVSAESKDKRKASDQIEKEIKRWRKSYKYLLHLCDVNHPHNKTGADACLVEYIERDGYNNTLQRLITLKLRAMADLYLVLITSMENLENCLKSKLSLYLETVRILMESLNKCYTGKRGE